MKNGYNTPNNYYISSMKEQGKEEKNVADSNKIGCFGLILIVIVMVVMVIWSNF